MTEEITRESFTNAKMARLRDRLACAICNLVLNYLATPWYRAMIGGSIRLGLETATKGKDTE